MSPGKAIWALSLYRPGLYLLNFGLWMLFYIVPIAWGLLIGVFFDILSGKSQVGLEYLDGDRSAGRNSGGASYCSVYRHQLMVGLLVYHRGALAAQYVCLARGRQGRAQPERLCG